MTLAELEWLKERDRLFGRPKPDQEPERKPQPVPAPIDPERFTLNLYGELIARAEMPV